MTRTEEIEARLAAGYEIPCGFPLVVRDVDYLLAENKRMREALETALEDSERASTREIIRAALKGIEP